MNVQGRRGEISCDNKGERLIHKKKKKKKWLWRAQPLSSSGRRDAVTARTRGRRSQAPGPAAQPLVAPTIGNASGAGRRKAKPPLRPQEPAPRPGAEGRHGSGEGRWVRRRAPPARSPELCSPRARGAGTHFCARAHTQIYTKIHT